MWKFNLPLIAERRKKLGYTIEQMAEKTGLAKTSYFRYEKGISKLRADMLPLFATVLKINVNKFFTKEAG